MHTFPTAIIKWNMKKNNGCTQRKEPRKEALIESLRFPKDICMGAMKITLTGNREAWIENYRGILEYTQHQILLQGKDCQVCFEGTRLTVDYYTNEDMKISGCISCVSYH